MKQIKRLLVLVFVLVASLAVFAGCNTNTPDPKPTEKVTVQLAGETADANGAYSAQLLEGAKKTYTLVVGTLTDYTFTASVTEPTVVKATATATSLEIEALAEGTAVVTLSEASEKANDLTINVTVTAETVEKVAPTSVMLNNTTGGTGEIGDPFTVEFTTNGTSAHTLTVRPNDADPVFVWEKGTIEEGKFTASESKLHAEQSGTTLTLSVEDNAAGTYFLRGTAATGDLEVYLKATVTEHVALTAIEANLTASEEAGYDYEFVTAKGTTWDMTNGISARGQNLLDGNVIGGYQAPLNLTYFANLYSMEFTAVPANATSTTWVITSSEEGVFTLAPDGAWSANGAGTAVVTVTNVAKEAEIKIKVTVVDTLAEGILKSEFDAAEVKDDISWNFDENADDYEFTKGNLEQWHLVMNKTVNPKGDDGNQKIFYLGNATRVYGICLETRLEGLSTDTVAALAWTKATIPATATTLEAYIGNNDKTQGKYRILLVEEDGTSHDLTGWVEKTKANDDGKPFVTYEIPDAAKGKTVAIVVQAGQNKQNDNCELHIKGIWLNTYKGVTSVSLAEASASVGQGGSYQIRASVLPADASYKGLSYAVTNAPEGGNGKVTVDASGNVSVSADAPVGAYEITVASTDNAEATALFTLTVTEYNPLTSFEAMLAYGGRALAINSLKDATLALTFDANGIYTDPVLTLECSWNEGASVTTYEVTVSAEGVVAFSNGTLTAIGAGSVTVTITPTDNEALACTFTVNVAAFDAATSLVEGTNITKTFAALMGADESTNWSKNADYHRYVFATVDKRHGNAKFNYDGNVMQLENHVVEANSDNPVNIGYNKVNVPANAQYLTFEVHGHNDDRYLESANLRVRVLYLEGGEWQTEILLNWTTVANRWKQSSEWYRLALDLSEYAGKEVILLFEAVGGLQNNGNYPKGSDSSAGGYLYIRNIEIVSSLPEGALVPVDGNIAAGDTYRMYANNDLAANGWAISANKDAGAYADGGYQPLTLTYGGSLAAGATVSLQLTTASIYSNSVQAALYPWGVFPALNNSHEAAGITLASSNPEIFTVEGGLLTPVKNGEANLTVTALAYGSTEKTITFTVKVVVAAVDIAVTARTTAVTIETGSSYTLDYYTAPEGKEVTISVVSMPDGGANAYTLEGDVFSAKDNAPLGDYVVRIAAKEAPDAYAEVTITVTKVTSWGNKNAIIDANTGWKLNDGGSCDWGVGEGADLNRGGSYWYRNVNLSGLNQITVNVRTFVRGGETDGKLYVSVVVDGVETRIIANGQSEDTILIDTTDAKFDSPNAFVYDLSAYEGKTVEIRIGSDQGTHVVITSIALA